MKIPLLLGVLLSGVPAQADDDGGLSAAFSQALPQVRRPAADGTGVVQPAAPLDAPPRPSAVSPAPVVAPSWPSAWTRDVSDQLPGTDEQQGDIGTCHDFTAIGLLEAALKRRYGSAQPLSTADLFVQHNVLSARYLSGFKSQGAANPKEGGFCGYDAAFGIAQGVSTELNYAAFQNRYDAFIKTDFAPEAARYGLKPLPLPPLSSKTPWQIAVVRAQDYLDASAEVAGQNAIYRDLAGDELNDQALTTMQKIYAKVDPRSAQERSLIRERLKGFRVFSRSFRVNAPQDYQGTYDLPPSASIGQIVAQHQAFTQCAREGAARSDLIAQELDAGRPVGIAFYDQGMDIYDARGLPVTDPATGKQVAFRTDGDPSGYGHEVVAVGYAVWQGGRFFKIRNWWGTESLGSAAVGGVNQSGILFDVDMCRVRSVVSVLAPDEQHTNMTLIYPASSR